MTSPYAYYQFWINADDADVVNYLKLFTFRSRAEIEEIEQQVREQPHLREAQRILAEDVTTLTHGAEETKRVKEASAALFGSGDLRALDAPTLDAALGEAPHVELERTTEYPTYADLLALTELLASKGAARRAVSEGGAYANNIRITDAEARPTDDDLLAGGWLLLRRGKRSLAGVRIG
jgi:tyrosyl-tRNA synthetase